MNQQELINILVCPQCKGGLLLLEKDGASGFNCPNCKLVYPVEEDIPIMLIEQAIPEGQWPKTRGEAECAS